MSCFSGKRSFSSEALAQADAERVYQNTGTYCRPYYCPPCEAWHVTSSFSRAKKRRESRKRQAGRELVESHHENTEMVNRPFERLLNATERVSGESEEDSGLPREDGNPLLHTSLER